MAFCEGTGPVQTCVQGIPMVTGKLGARTSLARCSPCMAVLAIVALSHEARGQALSAGLDGGLTFSDPAIEFVDTATRRDNQQPTFASGIDVAGYYLFSRTAALGLAIAPSFYAAGPQPSVGINFLVGPRFLWRPAWFHLALDAGLVVSAFDDRCDSPDARPTTCEPTRPSEPAAIGFGVGLAPLFRVWRESGIELLLGPALRYQRASYRYTTGDDGFALQTVQAVFAARIFVDLLAE